MIRRIFVEDRHAHSAKSLLADLKSNLNISIDSLRILQRYDVEGLDDALDPKPLREVGVSAAVVPGHELLHVRAGVGLELEVEPVSVEGVRRHPVDPPLPDQVGPSVLDTAWSPLFYIGVLER